MKVRVIWAVPNRHYEEHGGRKGKAARDAEEERNTRFIFAGFDTGANGVLNGVMGS